VVNVALIVYRRPETTRRVCDVVAKARPQRLFVIADGPKDSGEAPLCERARNVVEQVSWPCEVHRCYAQTNLGSRVRVSSGLDWVFSQVPEAIILEDDCVPHASFFRFCRELLEYYRDDERVWQIGGTNHAPCAGDYPFGYYFSRYAYCWGWATWRRAWQQFDADIRAWPAAKAARKHHAMLPTQREVYYFEDLWDDALNHRLDAWDYQWAFAQIMSGGLSIVPKVNLVRNIGFGAGSTHTKVAGPSWARLPVQPMAFPLIHPATMTIDRREEKRAIRRIFFDAESGMRWWLRRLRNRHFYGQLIRCMPLIGALWARLRRDTTRSGR